MATSDGASLPVPVGELFEWDEESTYIRNPPFFEGVTLDPTSALRHHRRAGAGDARRQRDHRPYFAGRLDPGR